METVYVDEVNEKGIEQYSTEGTEVYELIFRKYKTIQDAAFKFKRSSDFLEWQRDMLRCYADSFLIDDCLAGGKVYVVCTDHKWKAKTKGKGKLKATFKVLVDETNELADEHIITMHKIPEVNVHRILDTYTFLLELGLNGYLVDDIGEDATHLLDKFAEVSGNHRVVESTREFIEEIKKVRLEAQEKIKEEADTDNVENDTEES